MDESLSLLVYIRLCPLLQGHKPGHKPLDSVFVSTHFDLITSAETSQEGYIHGSGGYGLVGGTLLTQHNQGVPC